MDITHLWDWQESTACDTPTVVWADLRMFYLRASALDALVALNVNAEGGQQNCA